MFEHISDIHQWTPSLGRAKVGRPARTYIQQICAHTRCNLVDSLETGGERRPEKSVIAARHDDDDDDPIYRSGRI